MDTEQDGQPLPHTNTYSCVQFLTTWDILYSPLPQGKKPKESPGYASTQSLRFLNDVKFLHQG